MKSSMRVISAGSILPAEAFAVDLELTIFDQSEGCSQRPWGSDLGLSRDLGTPVPQASMGTVRGF